MTKTPMTQHEKENFLEFLASATPDDLNELIKKNGKNKDTCQLFVFLWDKLKKDNKLILK